MNKNITLHHAIGLAVLHGDHEFLERVTRLFGQVKIEEMYNKYSEEEQKRLDRLKPKTDQILGESAS